jgi:hypothetical protein
MKDSQEFYNFLDSYEYNNNDIQFEKEWTQDKMKKVLRNISLFDKEKNIDFVKEVNELVL